MIDNPAAVEALGFRPSRSAGVPFTELGIAVRYESQNTVVELTGELDLETAPTLTSELDMLEKTSRRRLVIVLSPLAFCDSSGLGALVRANRRAAHTGGWVRICGAAGTIQTIIGIAGLPSVLRCYGGVAEALADV
jgi:anti-sigma B factor antagonist